MVDKLMANGAASIEQATAFLRAQDINLQYVVIPDGEEFTSEELRLLCYCGGLYETKYKIQKRSKEVRNIMSQHAQSSLIISPS